MVMIPLFGEQGDNAQRLVSRGIGVVLNFYDITTDVLVNTLDAVINDSRWDICLSRSFWLQLSDYSCVSLIRLVSDW